jgi:hypothetical protein
MIKVKLWLTSVSHPELCRSKPSLQLMLGNNWRPACKFRLSDERDYTIATTVLS